MRLMEKLIEYRTCLGTLRFLRMGDGSLLPVVTAEGDYFVARPVPTESEQEITAGSAVERR